MSSAIWPNTSFMPVHNIWATNSPYLITQRQNENLWFAQKIFSSSSVMGLSNGESSWDVRLLGCTSATSSELSDWLLGSRLTCSTSLSYVSPSGCGGFSKSFRFSIGVVSLGFFPDGFPREFPGLSSGVAKSSLILRTFVVPWGRTARVLAVKVSNCLAR